MGKEESIDAGDDTLWQRAQVGLGFLLPTNDWTWWHHPDSIRGFIFEAVKARKVVDWGGQSQLANIEAWLDRRRAMLIADSVSEVKDIAYDLRIRLKQELWTWASPRELNVLRERLTTVLPDSFCTFDWPKLRRPRRYYAHRGQKNTLVVSGSPEMRDLGEAVASALDNAEWSENSRRADIVVAPAAYARSFSYADLVILIDEDPATSLVVLDDLRSKGARCVLRAFGNLDMLSSLLQQFARNWSVLPTFDAIVRMGTRSDLMLEILATNITFLDRSVELLDYRTGSGDSVARSEPKYAQLKPVDGEPALLPPHLLDSTSRDIRSGIPSARVMYAEVYDSDQRIDQFPRQGTVMIRTCIRYQTLFDTGRLEFPDHLVSWTGQTKVLKVHMVSLGREIASGDLILPQRGNSNFVKFHYNVSDEPVDIRLIVADGARILQTSRLRGEPGGSIQFAVESASDNMEIEKPSFDLALLVNNSLGNRPSATVLTPDGITITVLDSDDIAASRQKLLGAIGFLVKNPAVQPDPTFYTLAAAGKLLHDGLVHYIPSWPKKLKRVQLTNQSNAYFPLEFLYEGRIPINSGAPLCPERASCLNSGVAKNPCSIRSENQHLCPMGFMGVSAIIERQTWALGMPKMPWLSAPRDFNDRNKIASLASAAFAASNNADDFLDEEAGATMPVIRLKDLSAELGPMIGDWTAWESAVKSNPALLTLIPHIDDEHMYIGDNNGMSFAAIEDVHVGFGKPVVVAMGCSSAVGQVALASLPSVLLRCGAVVVIAALTEVLGRHANRVALQVAQKLREAALSPKASTMGEIIHAMRCSMLSNDLAIGLVVVAFGDADFVLGGP